MEKIAVERSVWIHAPINRVWLAVTDAQQLSQWYATYYKWEIPSLKVGAQVKFFNGENDIVHATIVVVDPPREFTVRWEADKNYPSMSLVTSFRLAEENGGTRATIFESGYEMMPETERQEWIEAVDKGYSMSVENWKAFVEGRPLPY
jgi:uncharacterized protein YndB with AHSA1/START domain